MFRFLRYIDALKRRSTDLSVARTLGESEDVVRIMTIHRSKGLEFPVVFLANIAGTFNTQDTRGDLLYHAHEGIGLRVSENTAAGRQKYDTLARRKVRNIIQRESIAEEMRILYVAMTRAQEKLILTGTLSITRTGRDALEQLRLLSEIRTNAGGAVSRIYRPLSEMLSRLDCARTYASPRRHATVRG